MASLASLEWPRLLEVEEFLQIDFGPDLKAELDDGIIRMMAGGIRGHTRAQSRLIGFFTRVLQNDGCFPYGSDMGVQTRERSLRYPDVTVDCGSSGDQESDRLLSNPRVIFEILSPSTRAYDLQVKCAEYRDIASVDTIVFIDLEARALIVHQRITGGWQEILQQGEDLFLPSLNLSVPNADIFG